MPSRDSVSEEIRARTEFASAVRTGINALMGRCGYSRERATLALLKELNRGNGPECKPTDEEIFDAMKRHNIGLDEANRAIIVSRAMRRELLSSKKNKGNQNVSPSEAVHRLISKLSLENILYESGEDDSDDEQNEILHLKIPQISRASSSSSINVSSSSATTSAVPNNSSVTSRKHARSKKSAASSPRKQLKTTHGRSKGSNSNISNSNTILVGRKRSIEDMDSTKQSSEVDTKAANGRPQHRASKRLHRSSAGNETVVSSGLNANK